MARGLLPARQPEAETSDLKSCERVLVAAL